MRDKNIRIMPHARRLLPALLASLGAVTMCVPVSAMGLGSASTTSRVGGPLRIEIPVQADDAERIELSCLRLASRPSDYGDDLPWLSKAKLSIEQRNGHRLLVISAPSNSHPALVLGVQVSCGMEMRRDYTLLILPPAPELQPDIQAPALRSTPVVEASATPRLPTVNTLTTLEGDTARSIANRLYPADSSAQRRMARALLAHNASRLNGRSGTYDRLPAGLTLEIPALPASLAVPPPREPGTVPTPGTAVAEPKPVASAPKPPPHKSHDRLVVSAAGDEAALQLSTSIGKRRELNEDQRGRLRTEMQLIATLDEKIATQLELADRLRQLEALQSRLKEDADRLESELRAQRALQQSGPVAASTPLAVPVAPPAVTPTAGTNSAWHLQPLLWLAVAAGLAAILIAARWAWLRRRHSPLEGETLPLPAGNEAGLAGHLIEPLSEADIWPDEEGHAPQTNPRLAASMEGALGQLSVSGLGPASMLQIVEDDVEEHDSAVELAEIMMSFGRVQGAAQTLADFIRANPKQAVKPWIKLLEVYRAADMRSEFDALTSQLNKTFNVRTVAWDEFEIARQAPESLEHMPHILARLHDTWGRRECQALLHELLRDNRQGTRQGFPLVIIDEILLLLGILETQIGPYRPEPGDPTLTPIATLSRSASFTAPTAPLAVPSIVPEELVTRPAPREPEPKPAPAAVLAKPEALPFSSSNSLGQLDFELDMTDLSKTLHINLDELGGDTIAPDESRH
ncbi:FimV family protein [Uliginosibacterium sp. 31-12]|uniref:type IV pilus assembly protein FimV n=1 Tax=Uliginosibacterium sp. 31-12 TaxID=3062781 RepID=UPI0026E45C11|nr:hypothetical protein [Uliginosibacterium sp. 31-12]MDO6386932.1 hypothetical protein [Uliginosibacterium sp. 31-12]